MSCAQNETSVLTNCWRRDSRQTIWLIYEEISSLTRFSLRNWLRVKEKMANICKVCHRKPDETWRTLQKISKSFSLSLVARAFPCQNWGHRNILQNKREYQTRKTNQLLFWLWQSVSFPFESYQLLDAFPFNPQGQISHPQFPPRIIVTHSTKRPLIAYNYSGSILVAPIKGVYTSIHFWNFIANNMNAFKPNFCCYPFGIAFLSVYLLP